MFTSRARRGNQLRVVSSELSTRNDTSRPPTPAWREKKNLRLEGHAANRWLIDTAAKVAARRAKASAGRSNYSDRAHDGSIFRELPAGTRDTRLAQQVVLTRHSWALRRSRPISLPCNAAARAGVRLRSRNSFRTVTGATSSDRMYRIYPRKMYTWRHPVPRSKI